MPLKEEYSTIGATGIIQQEGNKLVWTVDQGGEQVTGSETIGDQGLNEALHRCRKAIDALAEKTPVHAPKPQGETVAGKGKKE